MCTTTAYSTVQHGIYSPPNQHSFVGERAYVRRFSCRIFRQDFHFTHRNTVLFLLHRKCSGSSSTSSSKGAIPIDMSEDGTKTVAWHEYVISLYWAAATMTSTGYGDISAHTTPGRAVALVAMLVGLLLYGYCLSSIAATLANSDAPR